MNSNGYFVIICNLMWLLSLCQGKITVQMVDVKEKSNPEHLKLLTIVRNTPAGLVVDLDANLTTNLEHNLFLWVDIQTKTDQGTYETLFKSENLNLCMMLENAKQEPMAVPFLNNVQKYGNIPLNCPFHKGHYYLHGFQVDGEILPSFTPSGEFRMKFGIIFPNAANITAKLFEMNWDVIVENTSKLGFE